MRRILVVDDEDNVRELIQEILEEQGYGISGAVDGAQALARMQEEAFDLVVTDLKMPVMDGMELVQKIHARFPDIPVIIITAYGTLDTARQAMAYGACGYILKPCDILEIRWAVANALERREYLRSLINRRSLANIGEMASITALASGRDEIIQAIPEYALRETGASWTSLSMVKKGGGSLETVVTVYKPGLDAAACRSLPGFVAVPLIARGETLGLLSIGGKEASFTPEDVQALSVLAQQAALGLLLLSHNGNSLREQL